MSTLFQVLPTQEPDEPDIRIDGNPNDDGWQHATRFDMKWDRFAKEADPPTTTWICWDEQALYVAVTCELHKGAELYVPAHGRDNVNLFLCDGIELFLDPGKTARRYGHFIISAKGDVYDSMMTPHGGGGIYAPPNWNTIFGDPDWNAGAEVRAVTTDREYSIEARIPLRRWVPPRQQARYGALTSAAPARRLKRGARHTRDSISPKGSEC